MHRVYRLYRIRIIGLRLPSYRILRLKKREPGLRLTFVVRQVSYNSGTISNATMLMILISGFTAGPAVSL